MPRSDLHLTPSYLRPRFCLLYLFRSDRSAFGEIFLFYCANKFIFVSTWNTFVSTWNTFGQITEMWNISGHQSQHTNTRCTAAALPPAALPSLSMATLAMDPIRSAEAPHDPNRDAQRPGLRKLHLISLFGALKWRQSKN